MSEFAFGTKGQTLKRLRNSSKQLNIPKLYITTWSNWKKNKLLVIKEIQDRFRGNKLAIRSSSLIEDGNQQSMAGAFESFLNINSVDPKRIEDTINSVFASYKHISNLDEVLLQTMITEVDASGVIMTRNISDGSPYYVISYDDVSGKTDTITSGYGEHKTIYVLRNHDPSFCDSPRIKKMLDLAKLLEKYTKNDGLDIEFVLDKFGRMHLLQLRRITTGPQWEKNIDKIVYQSIEMTNKFLDATSKNPNKLMGSQQLYGTMPDWNPAELLGPLPENLSISLFRNLITNKTWSLARKNMGYAKVDQHDLMVLLSGKPFIDVRASFNSLVPDGLSFEIGNKIVDAWLSRLINQPNLHDKVEFEVIQSAMTCDFDQVFKNRYSAILTKNELNEFKQCLTILTNNLVDISLNSSLKKAINKVQKLEKWQTNDYLFACQADDISLSSKIERLLSDCKNNGTLQFSIIARHAFIAEDILRSFVRMSVISEERLAEFKVSIHSVAQDIANDTARLSKKIISKEEFIEKYGHLRPGSFDVTSLSYRDRLDLFENLTERTQKESVNVFELSDTEVNSINSILESIGISKVDANSFFLYARLAIEWRELSKFIFTKNLSAVIEYIRSWGIKNHIAENELAYLDINIFKKIGFDSDTENLVDNFKDNVPALMKNHQILSSVKVNFICKNVKDLIFVPVQRSEPNYISKYNVKAPLVHINNQNKIQDSIDGKIVCIESADPGFDWIFSCDIVGLVTRFGGANSHMAIRCAELNLPAAIGCGEELYQRLLEAKVIELNCSKKITTIYA